MRPNNAFPSNTPLLISTKVCQTSELLTWLTNFSFSCMQSQYLSMLFVVYPSGVSRATLSCLHRLSARSSSSLTSSPSPPILMSFMRMPKNSLEDRCVHCDPLIFLFSFRRVHHTYNLLHTDSVWSDSAMRFLCISKPSSASWRKNVLNVSDYGVYSRRNRPSASIHSHKVFSAAYNKNYSHKKDFSGSTSLSQTTICA